MAVLALAAGACAHDEPVAVSPATTVAPATAPPATAPPTTKQGRYPVEPGWYLTAIPNGTVQGYDGPDGTPTDPITNLYYDIPTALPVFEQQPGWVHVRLAPKPNGSTTWLRLEDVTVGKTPWKIVVNLATTHLQLYNAGVQVLDAPVGIGTDRTPTVTGDYFVTFLQKPESPGYGPFVMITSGHSDVLLTWQGFPDGILGIHGPIGSDAAIGTTGARISNGCIRMHVADQEKLADVLPGTPLEILAA